MNKNHKQIKNDLKEKKKNFFNFIVFFMVQNFSETHFKKANTSACPDR